MPERPPSRTCTLLERRRALLALSAPLVVLPSGCINSLVMMSKVLLGDPIQPSGFETVTGISLAKENKRILLHCTAPGFISLEYDSLAADVQDEVIRRMKRRGMAVLHPDAAANILDGNGGTFDPNLLARELRDVDYIFHVKISSFQLREENSPNLFRGRCNGTILGYEVNAENPELPTLRVYDQTFATVHPVAHPVTADQMPKNVFIRRFIDEIATDVGRSFYSVSQSELFAR